MFGGGKMYTGFELQIDKSASIFGGQYIYTQLQKLGESHLDKQKAKYENDLIKYVNQKELDGTEIQNDWFPQVEADIFISHSHHDKELACALAGWINKNFGLKCFIDSNVWGYSKFLLDGMNSRLSDKFVCEDGGCIYDYDSCNHVSEHVNAMLSIALQKMIDKVEAVIVLNTDNAVRVCSDTQMEKTYSPWIYSEIICTQLIRKKSLIEYRKNYNIEMIHKSYATLAEYAMLRNYFAISYSVSLKHLESLNKEDLEKWEKEYSSDKKLYDYPLDALYKFIYPGEVENAKQLYNVWGDRLNELQYTDLAYVMEEEVCSGELYDMSYELPKCLLRCRDCKRWRSCKE